MKTFFSEYKYSHGFKKASPKEREDAWHALFEMGGNEYPQAALRCFFQSIMLDGKGTDYFVESRQLADLLLGMVKDFTVDVLDVFSETRHTAFVIHPVSPLPAVLVGIGTNGAKECICQISAAGTVIKEFGPETFKTVERITSEDYSVRMAVGLALYLRFFPEAVKEGLPEIAKHPAHYKGAKCVRVGLTERLIDRSGAKPHIRQAHFRFLGSEKFTHKQNSYVLVKASFVRGKCKIVVEVENK